MMKRFMRQVAVLVRTHWFSVAATVAAAVIIAVAGWFLVVRGDVLRAQSGLNCSSAYLIDVTLPTGARWEMCWEHRAAEGIVLHDIHYTPAGGNPRRQVLAEAAIGQIHVPYDDNGARFHDLSDFGLGDVHMMNLTADDCPSGTLLPFAGKNVICMQIQQPGYAYKYYDQELQSWALSLFSVSAIGQYNYIPVWKFNDTGAIDPSVGATGRLQRFAFNDPTYGWYMKTDSNGPTYAVSHTHNYYWRLDFDLDGAGNDRVEEFNFTPTDGNTRYSVAVTPFTTEAARTVSPANMRSWRILDTVTTNSLGQPISYHLEPMRVGHLHQGPVEEPFTNNQFYVTVRKTCEKWVSHNPTINNCPDNLSGFVNGENIVGQDIVLWYGVSFHHLPRNEDQNMMDAHWDGFSIVPRDWTASNPLDNVVVGPQATATNTPVVPPTATNTAVPPTATNTPVVPPTATNTPLPPTATFTPGPPTATNTPAPPTATFTPLPPTATATPVPPTATPGAVVCATYNSPNVPRGLPFLVASNSSTLTVPAGMTITDINASVYMTHTYVGDVSIRLTHQPSGRSAMLIDRPGAPARTFGCPNDDINAVLDDQASLDAETRCAQTRPTIDSTNGPFRPNEPLAVFNNLNAGGTWVLTAIDADPGSDFGTIVNWGLQICGAPIGGSSEPTSGQGTERFYYDVPVIENWPVEAPKHTTDLTNSLFLPQVSR